MGLGQALQLRATGRLDHTQPAADDGILDRGQDGVLFEDLEEVAGTAESKLSTTNLQRWSGQVSRYQKCQVGHNVFVYTKTVYK